MASRRNRRQQPAEDDQDHPSTSDLLRILAQQQTVLTTIAQSLVQSASNFQSGNSSQAPQHNATSQPPIIRGLPTPTLPSPDNLSIPQFRDWKQRWEDYSKAQQLGLQPLDTQHGILRTALDSEWTMLWNSGRLLIVANATIAEIITTMEGYLRSRRNPLLDRQQFHRRDQMSGESVDRYYAALKSLDDASAHEIIMKCLTCHTLVTSGCMTCQSAFPLDQYLQDIRIRDRLICGLHDKEMQRRVLSEPISTLTLAQVLSICTAVENVNTAGATLGSTSFSAPDAAAAHKKSSYKKQQQKHASTTDPPKTSQQQGNRCKWCGNETHSRSECKAKDATCGYCNLTGHFRKMCFKENREKQRATERGDNPGRRQSPSPAPSTGPQGNNISNAAIQSLVSITTMIGNSPHFIKWLPDTGAEVDAISYADYLKLGAAAQQAITPDIEEVVAANGSSLGPVGSAKATLTLAGKVYHTTLRVYQNVTTPLLSKRGCIALGLIDQQWPYSRLTAGAITTGSPVVTSPPTPSSDNSKAALVQDFAATFDDTVLRPMHGTPMKIELVPEAIPSKRYKAHTIPFHWREKVKEQLDSMQTKGVIEPVPIGEAIDWCHPMVVVPKKGTSEPRITVDLTNLNKFVRRPAYPVRVPKEIVARIPPGNRYFTTLDARHGYWQVPLDQDSKKLTTFITPWGSYRFQRNVMGLISAGDEHNRRGDEALQGIPNVEKICEDIIIFDKDISTHTQRVRDVIQKCQDAGITLNSKKFVFAQPSVEWCGFLIGPDGYTPAPHLVSALLRFPTPASRTDVRSFCGLVQQFEAFSHRITELIAPIRSLLSASAEFIWEEVHQQAFKRVIKELSSPHVLTHFQPGYPLRLETDAAQSKGLGYALWQQQPDTQWKLLQAGSRYVTPTESRYSASEIEMLAVVWAIKKCRLFLLGQSFDLIVDHRPLIPIINSKTLDEIENPRLQRLKEKLSSFRLTAIWRAGTKHTVVDVFSRFPVADPDEEDIEMGLDDDPAPLIASIQDPSDGSRIIEDPLLRGVKESSLNCSEYRRLRGLITNGFGEKASLDDDLHPYWRFKDNLTIHEDLIFLGSRILVPQILRSAVLKTLHSSHQGQQRTLNRARQAVFWPNITNDIKNVVNSCRECQAHLPSHTKEPLQSDSPAQFPFQKVGADLFSYGGYEYLIMVDQFSGWINIAKCGVSATTSTVIKHLQSWITDVGIPVQLRSDNGPQFSSFEFQTWATKWGIDHVTSSPHYPQSNGLAESAVKSLKYLLEKSSAQGDIASTEFQEGLMELRNTPRANGASPAHIIFGAPIRTKLPLHRHRFIQAWQSRLRDIEEKSTKLKQKALDQYNLTAKPLSDLAHGDVVLIQHYISKRWTIPAQVLEPCNSGRSYLLRTESGRVICRNRRYLRHFHPSQAEPVPANADAESYPRRSPRQRRPPQRFAFSLRGSRRSPLEGGHDGVSTGFPQTKQTRARSPSTSYQSGLNQAKAELHQHYDDELDPSRSTSSLSVLTQNQSLSCIHSIYAIPD